jgi:hypothetical protein
LLPPGTHAAAALEPACQENLEALEAVVLGFLFAGAVPPGFVAFIAKEGADAEERSQPRAAMSAAGSSMPG